MIRAGERDCSGNARAAGSAASEWTGFTDPSRATDRRRRDSRLLDRRMRGRRESVGTLATIERPTPTSAGSSDADPISRRAKNRKGERRRHCGSRIGARAGGETPKRDRPEAGRPGQRDAADVCCRGPNLRRGARSATKGSGRAGRDGFVRSAHVGRLLRRGGAVAGEDAEAQANTVAR